MPPGARAYWLAGELTRWKPGGMVTVARAMLPAVGLSHRTSVTAAFLVLARGPPKVLVALTIRTGRYDFGFTYSVHSPRAHFSPTARASPGCSRSVTGTPVIFLVSWPSIHTCPVTEAAPQASVESMKDDKWPAGTGTPLISIRAVMEHALAGTISGDRLHFRL